MPSARARQRPLQPRKDWLGDRPKLGKKSGGFGANERIGIGNTSLRPGQCLRP